jgi:ADP-ribose pyrophosphatase YjhB (NUDIX family)
VIRRFISAVLKVIFHHPVMGVTIIPILPDDQIVLVKRRDTGKWSLPGGMVDWGNDVPITIKRELKEETGLKLVKMGRLVGVYSSPHRDPRLHSIIVSVEIHVRGNFKIEDTREILEIKAFSKNSLPLGNLSHDHDRQLQDYLQGITTIA